MRAARGRSQRRLAYRLSGRSGHGSHHSTEFRLTLFTFIRIANGAGHPGPAAMAGLWASPGPVRVNLTNPSGIVALLASHIGTNPALGRSYHRPRAHELYTTTRII